MAPSQERLADQVFERLLKDIVSGNLLPGTQMAELDLGKQWGLSRTPIREALIKLAEIGLVNIVPQRGTFVAPISPKAFRSAQFVREHLECALVVEAIRYIDATSLRELNEVIKAQEQAAADDDGTGFYEADEEFHYAIARISQHEDIWSVIRHTKVHFDRVRHLTLIEDKPHIPLLIEQHREILAGLANCDEAKAVAAMRRHLREVFRRAEGIFARHASATS
jgi:DNA-binding GntR family transcriptional regulator